MNTNKDATFIIEMTGKVKNLQRNNDGVFIYGFILPTDPKYGDVFVHHKDIEPWREGFKELSQGDSVKFQLHKSNRGKSGLVAREVEVKREQIDADSFGNEGNR